MHEKLTTNRQDAKRNNNKIADERK